MLSRIAFLRVIYFEKSVLLFKFISLIPYHNQSAIFACLSLSCQLLGNYNLFTLMKFKILNLIALENYYFTVFKKLIGCVYTKTVQNGYLLCYCSKYRQ